MSTYVLFRIFYFCDLFGISIRTTMQNLESVAQKMSELCSIWQFGGHFVFQKNSKFVQTVHMNFHAKSGLCSSRNERVMLNFVIWRPF